MSCLHFKVDRRSRICPDCGIQLLASPVTGRIQPPPPIQNQPVDPPPQEIAAQTVQSVAPVVELPEGDDIYEILRKLKGKKQAAPPLPNPEIAKVIAEMKQEATTAVEKIEVAKAEQSYDQLRAETDKAVAAATPDWIKDGRIVIPDGAIRIQDSVIMPELTETQLAELCAPTSEETKRNEQVAEILAGPSTVQSVQPSISEEIDPDLAPDLAARMADRNASDDYAPGTYPDEPIYSFLGGTAGTGKTYTAAQRVLAYDDAKLVATTGIAAVNLGGVTINSLLQYGDTKGLRANYEIGKLGALLRRMTQSGYFRLIVDEVSMMDGHQLDILVTAIDELNEWLGANGKRLFGMTLVGDFAQLPPIDAPFVFQRASWGKFEPHITLLTEPRRQADEAFVRALQAVRRGDRQAAMQYFRPLIVSGSEEKFDGSTIMATNAEVDRYNKLRMMDISLPAEWFKADRVGEQLSEWKKNIPDNLEMKPGALVMILANKSSEGEMIYANGDLGHFVKKHNDNIAEVTLIRHGGTVLVASVIKEHGVATGHAGRKLPRNEVKGSIRYMPLRVAYATTCHKSQGLSLDKVQIMFHNRFWANPGMLYVALSRARTPQGLRLVGTPEQFEARIVVNPDIRRWL